MLHRGSFASEGDAAGQRNRAADELADDGAQGDHAVGDEQRELGLRNAAAARQREIADRAASRATSDPTVGTSERRQARRRRIHPGGQPASEEDEGDDDQADERADDEAEDQREVMLVAANPLQPATRSVTWPPGGRASWRWPQARAARCRACIAQARRLLRLRRLPPRRAVRPAVRGVSDDPLIALSTSRRWLARGLDGARHRRVRRLPFGVRCSTARRASPRAAPGSGPLRLQALEDAGHRAGMQVEDPGEAAGGDARRESHDTDHEPLWPGHAQGRFIRFDFFCRAWTTPTARA